MDYFKLPFGNTTWLQCIANNLNNIFNYKYELVL